MESRFKIDRQRLSILLTGIFIVLCCVHYFSQRPLWLDEQLILKNMQQYQAEELFRPLEYCQAFPRVHLILLQAFAAAFDNHVLALRLFSFIFMVMAFLLWMEIYRREISRQLVFGLTLLAFVASYKMSYYAAECKPYAMDVLVIGIFTWFSGELKTLVEKKRFLEIMCWSIILPCLMVFSYAALFGFWMITYNLFLLAKDYRRVRIYAIANLFSSAAVLWLFYRFDLHHSLGTGGLHDYWQGYFINTDSLGSFIDTAGDGVKKIVTHWYALNSRLFIRLGVIFVPFVLYGMIVGGIKSIKQSGGRIASIDAIGLVLFLELVVLGVLHKYPFTGERITLFLAPFIFYYTANTLAAIPLKWLRYLLLGYFFVFCLACLGNTVWIHVQEYNL